jgi:hypothetical protein
VETEALHNPSNLHAAGLTETSKVASWAQMIRSVPDVLLEIFVPSQDPIIHYMKRVTIVASYFEDTLPTYFTDYVLQDVFNHSAYASFKTIVQAHVKRNREREPLSHNALKRKLHEAQDKLTEMELLVNEMRKKPRRSEIIPAGNHKEHIKAMLTYLGEEKSSESFPILCYTIAYQPGGLLSTLKDFHEKNSSKRPEFCLGRDTTEGKFLLCVLCLAKKVKEGTRLVTLKEMLDERNETLKKKGCWVGLARTIMNAELFKSFESFMGHPAAVAHPVQ